MKVCSLLLLIFAWATTGASQSPSAVESELLGHLDQIEKASNYGGTSDYKILERENQLLRSLLLKYGKRADILDYDFPKMKERITVVNSPDRRLRTYSWDSNSGGTMHDFLTVYQFRSVNGVVNTWAEPYSMDVEERGAGAFVHDIFQQASSKGTIYLTVSTFIGSTSLAGQFVDAVRIDSGKLNFKPRAIRTGKGFTDRIFFEYDFFSVVDHPERPIKLVFFDSKSKSFRIPVVVEDSKTPQGRVTDRFITYKFNGRYFEKVS
jgi:hypothetical protein